MSGSGAGYASPRVPVLLGTLIVVPALPETVSSSTSALAPQPPKTSSRKGAVKTLRDRLEGFGDSTDPIGLSVAGRSVYGVIADASPHGILAVFHPNWSRRQPKDGWMKMPSRRILGSVTPGQQGSQ